MVSKGLEALDYFLGSYKEFLKGKDTYCQITLTREQATEFIKEVDEVKQALLKSQEQEKILEILKIYIYYSSKSHCIRMRDIRKSINNFDYEDLKEVFK